jgi:alkanesulfonate monooxygenase SsuD/methylene tetrahydromethanopterin reductase-like flavin-dependent oxidoreductase (luciferase family)
MSTPTLGLKLPVASERPSRPATKSAGEWAAHAEDLGYDSIWMSEAWGTDALVELSGAAAATDTIRLCTAIVNVYSRTPTVLAMAGATLQRRSDGRAVLGVGPSHAGAVEAYHGLAYDRPVRRTHEAIELVNELTGGGEPVSYDGEVFSVEGLPPFEESVPVYNAALGPANRRATGRVADGWLPYMYPVSALGEAFETVAETARETGRDPGDIEVTPQILAAVSDDPEAARDAVRDYVASYVGQLPNYRNALADWYPEEAAAIGEAWAEGGREAAMAAVTDELVHELGVAGTPAEARDQLRAVLETPVVDCPIVYVPRGVPDVDRDRTIEALAPGEL